MSEGRIRAFLALEFDDLLRGELTRLTDRLRAELPGVRWVRPEAWHLTLRFLGECRADAARQVAASLAPEARRCLPANAPTSGFGVFPEKGPPRVFWIGFEAPESVLELQRHCEQAAVAAGFPGERRPFRPHLTLGRFRSGGRPELPAASLPAARLEALTLFRSELAPGGAVYTPLLRTPPV